MPSTTAAAHNPQPLPFTTAHKNHSYGHSLTWNNILLCGCEPSSTLGYVSVPDLQALTFGRRPHPSQVSSHVDYTWPVTGFVTTTGKTTCRRSWDLCGLDNEIQATLCVWSKIPPPPHLHRQTNPHEMGYLIRTLLHTNSSMGRKDPAMVSFASNVAQDRR